jgi:hypothetical protein
MSLSMVTKDEEAELQYDISGTLLSCQDNAGHSIRILLMLLEAWNA